MAKKTKIKKTLVEQILTKAKVNHKGLQINALEGELPEEALIREIHEELNSQIEIISFVNEASYDYDFGTVVMKTFHARLVSGNLDLFEHHDSAWLEPNRLKTLNWAPVDRLAVELLSK